jgi:hypothetical protein
VLAGVVRLLGDDDVDRRWAAREAIADLLDQYGGQRPEYPSSPASAMGETRWCDGRFFLRRCCHH